MCEHRWFWIGQDTARNDTWRCQQCGVVKTNFYRSLTTEEQKIMHSALLRSVTIVAEGGQK